MLDSAWWAALQRSELLTALRDAARDALALVLPVECAGCGAPDRAVCGRCRAALAPRPRVRAGLELAPLSAHGVTGPDRVVPVHAALEYAGPARSAIAAAKDGGRRDAVPALAPALAAAVSAALAAIAEREGPALAARVEAVAVPGTSRARRRRGAWPLGELLARAGVRHRRVLVARGSGPAQKTLGREDRRRAVAGRFRIRGAARPIAGCAVLLIDDVVTTGATLEEAARTLEEAGARVVGVAVLAATPRRMGARDASAGDPLGPGRKGGDKPRPRV